ncbi:MAG TPA: PDZ domain-containing protein [Magnetospirillaceae bacterium]
MIRLPISARHATLCGAIILAICSFALPTLAARPLRTTPGILDDRYSAAIVINGLETAVGGQPGWSFDWFLRSSVGRQGDHSTQYQIYFSSTFSKPRPLFTMAASDQAQNLPVVKIVRLETCSHPGCRQQQDIGIAIDEQMLVGRKDTGFSVKISARDGTDQIITVTPALIHAQIDATNQVLASFHMPPIGVVIMPARTPSSGDSAAHAAATTPDRQLGLHVDSDMVTVPNAQERGLKVLRTEPGTIAEQAGLLPGDIITACDGVPILSAEDFGRKTSAIRAHGSVTVQVYRPSTKTESTFILGR